MVKIKNLTLKYKKTGQKALSKVSFSVSEGERVAILGPSGCGKTTLLNYLANLFDQAEIDVKGSVEIKKGRKLTFVFQEPRLLPWFNTLDNISFGLKAKRKNTSDAKNYLNLVGLKGYENYDVRHLSIGMQQRVNFARALACHPDLLLLDEPFSALDLETKKRLQNDFLAIIKAKKITTIFVTHNIEEAESLAEKIIIFSKSPGTVETIINKNDYKNLPKEININFDPFGG